ncbi:hypothetical protein [Marinirhabdus gelatinilytica]|uniref:Uncharacterized protein n=1 Tax=Marinirhabdus gelatinilytica TaxID=1703343 RepID=A0A370Q4B2_9FLAO|nr:hypothetical protein [Marinirhabdus gelatinilytica]RDK83222.1 hypothetical protein C8D94_10810 [Marinirhabdus gelatinilytica]
MKITRLFLTLFFFISSMVAITAQNFQEKLTKYMHIHRTQEQYSNAYDQLLVMLRQQCSSQEVPDALWEELQSDKDTSVEEILTLKPGPF